VRDDFVGKATEVSGVATCAGGEVRKREERNIKKIVNPFKKHGGGRKKDPRWIGFLESGEERGIPESNHRGRDLQLFGAGTGFS